MSDMSEKIGLLTLDVGSGAKAFSVMRGVCAETDVQYPYAGFNVCHYTGDSAEHVVDCRRDLAAFLGVDIDKLLIPRQTHSTNVAVIGDEIPVLEDIDALVTRRRDVALVINTADCLPIVFNDSANAVIGIAHGGWRGLYDGIVENTLEAMLGLGASLETIHVAIGPCICVDCYEVSTDFAERFSARFPAAVRYPTAGNAFSCDKNADEEKPHVDLREVARQLLVSSGISDSNIQISGECTRCNPCFCSARRLTVNSCRTPTIIKSN